MKKTLLELAIKNWKTSLVGLLIGFLIMVVTISYLIGKITIEQYVSAIGSFAGVAVMLIGLFAKDIDRLGGGLKDPVNKDIS